MKINAPVASPPLPNAEGGRGPAARNPNDSKRADEGADGKSTRANPNERLPALVPGEYATDTGDVHLGPLIPNVNVRHMTPREMSDLSFELYTNGALRWEEYELLAFQPELNPAFNSTVGALTGQRAEPDVPRDHLKIWEERFAFERKYNSDNPERLKATRQVVTVLRQLAAPLNVVV